MTRDSAPQKYSLRAAWLAVLSRATQFQLEAAYAARTDLVVGQTLHQVRPPEVGMLMLRGRVGGTGNPFNLGEATMVRCAVRLGAGPLGVAFMLGRNKRQAELAALFDALLQDPVHHDALQRTLIAPLAQGQAAAQTRRQQDVADSKVEFFTFVRGEA